MLPTSVHIISRPLQTTSFWCSTTAIPERSLSNGKPISKLCARLSSLSLTSSHSESLQIVEAVALYGALPLGDYHTALLYIVKTNKAAKLPQDHDVLSITGMGVLLLPARSVARVSVPAGPTPPTPKIGPNDGPRSNSPVAPAPLSASTIKSYLELLRQFATAKGPMVAPSCTIAPLRDSIFRRYTKC